MDVNHLLTVATFERLLAALAYSAQRGAQALEHTRPCQGST
jgi:hypothetical protein